MPPPFPGNDPPRSPEPGGGMSVHSAKILAADRFDDTLCLAAGAVECWTYAKDGVMRFHSPAGFLVVSAFCLGFPARVEV